MTTLEVTLRKTHDWAIDRMHILSEIKAHQDATSIQQEFAEWLSEDIPEHDIFSLEFIVDT